MSKAPALLVMAAGMGSRYGGFKQLDPVSPHGEFILDYSVYDALRAGFGDIILVIKRTLRDEFEETVGARLKRHANVLYAYQDMNDLPAGAILPEGRVKPWGTAHAVRAARDVIEGPFAVINADDFYGASAFRVMREFLSGECSPRTYAMVGYTLGNTLTDHGTVARGICSVRDDCLTGIVERTKIAKRDGAAAFTLDDGQTWSPLGLDTIVSMQFFGFAKSFLPFIESRFSDFLKNLSDPLKEEFLLPTVVGDAIAEGRTDMRVLRSPDRWFGVTYAQDKPAVVEAIARLHAEGAYPEALWG